MIYLLESPIRDVLVLAFSLISLGKIVLRVSKDQRDQYKERELI